ncbi:MAG: 2-isopropylmalate synthase [bacterium]|nr:2-isopropylmalate synthase [bacterium]MYF26099.1 2-isopropylmalate synthase [Acidimicrobiia bacterium]
MPQDQLIIFDTTLRDGEQAPGIALTPDEKLTIARQLAKLKVDVIEAGFAAASDGDFYGVAQIAKLVKGPVIASLSRCTPDDIDRAYDAVRHAERHRIHVFQSTSKIHMERMLRKTPEEVMRSIVESVRRARSYTDDVEFSPQDATRSDPDFMIATCRAAVREGATTINIPDTVGFATPQDYVELLKRVYDEVLEGRDDVIISTHCHNDLGLAVANSLTAIHAGARQIEGAINGIGERAGNTSTEEVIMAVATRQDHYQVEVGANTAEIVPTSRLVSRLTGYPIQFNKAVVGRNAFAHESGIHQHGVLRDRQTYEIMDPESVGATSQIVLGKHSGRAGFADALNKLDIVLEEDQFNQAFQAFKEMADRKVEINERELAAIVRHGSTADHETIRMVSMRVSGGTGVMPTATVEVTRGPRSAVEEYTGTGDGMVDATFDALKQAAGLEPHLLDYRVVPVTDGADAMAEVNVVIQVNGLTRSGRAISTDVVEGSGLAFVEALNRVIDAGTARPVK